MQCSQRHTADHQPPRDRGHRVYEKRCCCFCSQVPRRGHQQEASVTPEQAAVHCQHDACPTVLFAGGRSLPRRARTAPEENRNFPEDRCRSPAALCKAWDIKVPFQNCTVDAPASLEELVIGLRKVAFQGLQKKQLYFTDVELFKAGMSLESLELGLLVKTESTNFWKLDEYTFSHLTVQEFLAALYVSNEVLQTDADTAAKLLEDISFGDGHLTTFWIFLAGLLEGSSVEKILARALSDMSGRCLHPMIQLLQLCRCYAESLLSQSGTPSANVETLLHSTSCTCTTLACLFSTVQQSAPYSSLTSDRIFTQSGYRRTQHTGCRPFSDSFGTSTLQVHQVSQHGQI